MARASVEAVAFPGAKKADRILYSCLVPWKPVLCPDLWPSWRLLWGPQQLPPRAEGRALWVEGAGCCAGILGTLELSFPTLLLAGAPHPNPAPAPRLPCSAPSISVSPEQGMHSGHRGACFQCPSSSFHPGFTNWPLFHGCCLSLSSKGADRGPFSPQFLMLHFAPVHPPGGCTMEGQGTLGWGQSPLDLSSTTQTPSTMVMSAYVRPRLQAIHPFSWPFCSHQSKHWASCWQC